MGNSDRNSFTWLALALVVAIGLMVALVALSAWGTGSSYGMMGGGVGWGLLFMAVPAIVLILVLVAALGGLDERSTVAAYPGGHTTSALQILDQRYARSELSREEYERTKSDLLRGVP